MTLPASGSISMAQMRDEYGFGNPVSMNQFYGKNGLPSSGTIRFSDFWGKANSLAQRTITNGAQILQFFSNYGYNTYGTAYGSINNTAFLDKTIVAVNISSVVLGFSLSGVGPNSGWTTMRFDWSDATGAKTMTLNRTDGSFNNNNGLTNWTWTVGNNPFPYPGTTLVTWN